MKRKNIEELKNKSVGELQKLHGEMLEKLRGLRFELAAGKVKNIHDLQETRHTIARIQTFIREQSMKPSK